MTFDADTNARPLFKERVLWTLVIGLFFFLIYGSTNQLSALTAPHPSFFWQWERDVPFIPEFIVPYMSSDIVFIIAFLVAPTRASIQKLGIRYGLAITISALFFITFPLQFNFERPEVIGWTKFLFDGLSLDQPYNQFPSLHISLGFLAWHQIFKRLFKFGFGFVSTTIWFLLIAASTILVYQHHFIDLIGGAMVVIGVYWLIPDKGPSRMRLLFVTPRHLHMGFRYLIVATLFTVIAFKFKEAAIIFAWLAVSFLSVSASYVLGLNGFLRKKRNRHPFLSWIIFWPYLLGCWVNWLFWRARISLMAEIKPGIWIGARPGKNDWDQIKAMGICSIIDLVPELSTKPPTTIDHNHFPLLDIAIPYPGTLHQIAQKIDTCSKQGPVYIHCALGMSRSVLAVSALLISQGATTAEALDIVGRARPEKINRPYISIALELYENYLGKRS